MLSRVNTVLRRAPVWSVYLVGALYPTWLLYQALTGGLGVDPVKALEHALGLSALKLLVLGLAITPARKHLGLNLIKFRRSIGVIAFFYVLLHLLVWLVLDVQLLSQVWADILKRPYITVGMAAFALLTPLALTSNNWSVRKLGHVWRRLHMLVYAAVLLGGAHYLMLVKGFQWEPLIYLALIVAMLALRLPTKIRLRASRRTSLPRQS